MDSSGTHMPSLPSSVSGPVRDPLRDNNTLLTIVKAQIVFRLSTLTEDNFEKNQIDIRQVSSWTETIPIANPSQYV